MSNSKNQGCTVLVHRLFSILVSMLVTHASAFKGRHQVGVKRSAVFALWCGLRLSEGRRQDNLWPGLRMVGGILRDKLQASCFLPVPEPPLQMIGECFPREIGSVALPIAARELTARCCSSGTSRPGCWTDCPIAGRVAVWRSELLAVGGRVPLCRGR